ncbi:TrkH family potassium uptake protein [Methylophaga sp. OBS4]|uniref:TrkH family potassium uptake protein n=1 Tax=Methylophaga sp. OBS4 TaxID=2991935 RepID=UPI002256825A|nr:potassium transporter TrkG [Methylophaga sp. OBS4]MCX4186227.1 hypothetical protein [Methylophaga sp. OBS4]
MEAKLSTLTYAVRLPVIAKYTGQLLFLLAILSLPPMLVGVVFGEYGIALRYALVCLVLVLVTIPLSRLAVPTHIQTNEALVITSLAFLFSPLIMTYPLMASGLPYIDVLFEAVSAITTTGLTTVTELQARPATFLFARAWMQWYGGLGIVVLSIALLMGHHLAARQLAEPLRSETMATTASYHARRMLVIYLIMTVFGLGLLWALMGDGFHALLHVLSAVSTGGFAPHDASLAVFDSQTVRFAIIMLALLGAVPLPLYYFGWRKGFSAFVTDIELRGLLLMTIIICLLLVLLMYFKSGFSWQQSISHGLLLGISAQTTSGFSSMAINNLGDSEKLVIVLAMLTGGGLGSTAGGFKIIRLLILIRLVHLLIIRTSIPSHAMVKSSLGGRTLDNEDCQRAMLLVFLFIVTVLLSWLIFLWFGYPPLNALFEVVSATGTVGLSTGITQHELPALLKMVLCFDMLFGRLEIVALLISLYPRTWIGKRANLT